MVLVEVDDDGSIRMSVRSTFGGRKVRVVRSIRFRPAMGWESRLHDDEDGSDVLNGSSLPAHDAIGWLVKGGAR